MTYEEAWEKTRQFNSHFKNPLKENTLDSDTKCLNRKQYLHKSATILNILDISHKEEEELHLISIMSKYEYKRRDRVYQKATYTGEKAEYKRKKAKEIYNSEDAKIKYQEKLKAEGKQTEKEKISCRREKIKDLLAQGLKQKDICLQLDISKLTYIRDRKVLKEQGLI